MPFRLFVRAFVLFAAIAAPTSAVAERQWIESGPTPTRYEIAVTPDVEAATFSGEVRIAVNVTEPTSNIVLNALDLEIANAAIDGRAAPFATDAAAQTLTLTPRRPLQPGTHSIRVAYRGKINDSAFGVFRVSYQADGAAQQMIVTQFEPGDARRLAPMWDQPNRRAVFSLTVTAPANRLVVSNMPVAHTMQLAGGRQRVTFADTPSMASYLLFMAIGDFERITTDVDGVELGVVVRRGQTHRAREALRAGEESLRYFTEYFGIPYPLPKLDMIGAPGAGGFGAMENWGAIFYFDQALLVDETSSESERQGVFGTVAHEIAHQWFGDLVTMTWWDDLWLNEGFASWMAAKAIEARHPDWRPWLSRLTGGTAAALDLDAREGTHPVVQRVNTIEEANLAFDAITYQKGLAVIRMIEAYVGEEDFRNGVRAYLQSHLYGNAQTEDLWRAVQAASGQPVLAIARSFTNQPGFPILDVSGGSCPARSNTPAPITITQRRFAADEASRTGERWEIPAVFERAGQQELRAVIPAQAESGNIALPGCGAYIANAGQSGVFRVRYDGANLRRLTEQFATLESADQVGLLLDYWAFGRSGDAPFSDYLTLAAAVPQSADPLIVIEVADALSALADYAKDRPSKASVSAYARQVLRPFFDRFGWEPRPGETGNDALARARLITALADLGDDAVIAEARRRVRADDLPAGIRASLLTAYAVNADARDYEDLLARTRAATDFVEQRRLWVRLASAKDPALAQRTLAMVLGEDIPWQLRAQVLSSVAQAHPRMAWDFFVANRQAVEALLDPLQRPDYAGGIASASSDPAIAEALLAYARDLGEGAQRSVASNAAAIRLYAQTIQERMPVVEAWIAERQAPAGHVRRPSAGR